MATKQSELLRLAEEIAVLRKRLYGLEQEWELMLADYTAEAARPAQLHAGSSPLTRAPPPALPTATAGGAAQVTHHGSPAPVGPVPAYERSATFDPPIQHRTPGKIVTLLAAKPKKLWSVSDIATAIDEDVRTVRSAIGRLVERSDSGVGRTKRGRYQFRGPSAN